MLRSLSLFLVLACVSVTVAAEDTPDYETKVAPLLKKYCSACHNPDDKDGGMSLESYAALQEGGDSGPALLPGDAKSSRMIRMLTGQAKPKMPPKDQPAPAADEIALLTAWIDSGAKGPKGMEPDRTTLRTPQVAPAKSPKAVTAVAWSPTGDLLAIARFGEVELQSAADRKPVRTLKGIPGKVNSVEFSSDGKLLLTASGIEGLYGEATLWNVADGTPVRSFKGHRDTLYSATLSKDGRFIATGSYDKLAILWNAADGSQVRPFKGHNDAIYDVAFSPDGTLLATASGDQTVKIWQVATGTRLDTLSQPLKEQYVVTFSPDGQFVAAAGVDNRIRVWKVISREKPVINPIVVARFAHEAPIVQLAYTPDGQGLVSIGDDRLVKVWDTKDYRQLHVYDVQPDVTPALALAPNGLEFHVGRMNGTTQTYPLPDLHSPAPTPPRTVVLPAPAEEGPMAMMTEAEPNDELAQATPITSPSTTSAVIHAVRPGAVEDVDLYRFESKAGQAWVLEINAARSKSPMDSKLEILDGSGKKVVRVNLQAVRDSYITFRGIDSTTRDCRVQNWEEMKLNELLYLNGEVVKLHTAPRGPDSGFIFYPDEGSRRGFFDTTPIAHAMGEPCYVVQAHSPQEVLTPNGLPVFPVYYENDDDGMRKLGTDSRVTFTAPADGTYFARVTDVRGFQGEKFTYQLTLRPSRPDFKVTLQGAKPTIGAGSGKEFTLSAERIDGFEGEIRVDVKNLPPGLFATTPMIIEAGHTLARGTINALPDAPAPTVEQSKAVEITATASIEGRESTKPVNNFDEIKLDKKPRLLVTLLPTGIATPPARPADPLAAPQPLEIEIAPGETITAVVRIERNGAEGRVQFEALNQNLPHGVIVDNIGLNGLMIVEGQTERTFFLTAADWVPETTRWFHLRSLDEGQQTSWPVKVRVKKK